MTSHRAGRSLQGPIAVLCNVRLAALAFAAAVLAGDQATSLGELAVLLIALPFSFRPLRRASRQSVVRVSAAFVLADGVVTLAVLVVAGLDSLALAYVAASLVIYSLWRGVISALSLLAALIALHLGVLVSGAASDATGLAVVARLLLFAAVAYAGIRLRELLLISERLDEQVQADRVDAASGEERARLARDMHDSLSKTLHGTHLLATVLADRLRREGSCAAAEVEVIAQAVDTARQDSRRLLAELRQESIENLTTHLRDVSTAWAESSSAELHLDLPPVDPPLSPQAREEMSRAVGELLENVSRHAQAANVSVHLRVVAGAVELVVSDDGAGIPPIDLAQLYRAGHFGLIGARERMARIGGTLVIRPGEPCGTEVTLTAPVGRAPLESRDALVAGVVPIHSYAGSEAPSDLGR